MSVVGITDEMEQWAEDNPELGNPTTNRPEWLVQFDKTVGPLGERVMMEYVEEHWSHGYTRDPEVIPWDVKLHTPYGDDIEIDVKTRDRMRQCLMEYSQYQDALIVRDSHEAEPDAYVLVHIDHMRTEGRVVGAIPSERVPEVGRYVDPDADDCPVFAREWDYPGWIVQPEDLNELP